MSPMMPMLLLGNIKRDQKSEAKTWLLRPGGIEHIWDLIQLQPQSVSINPKTKTASPKPLHSQTPTPKSYTLPETLHPRRPGTRGSTRHSRELTALYVEEPNHKHDIAHRTFTLNPIGPKPGFSRASLVFELTSCTKPQVSMSRSETPKRL